MAGKAGMESSRGGISYRHTLIGDWKRVDAALEHVFNLKFLFEVVTGLAVGVFAGVAGMPLGPLRLPALYLIVPTPQIAAGTNLGIDALTATTAAYKYWRSHMVDGTVFIFMGGFSCIGSFLGGYFSRFASYKGLLIFIGLVYFLVGLDMFFRAAAGESATETSGDQRPGEDISTGEHKGGSGRPAIGLRNTVVASLWGFVLGFIGGMVGLLMGSLRVPTMIKLMGLTPTVTAGTNMSISSFMAFSGFSGHLMHGHLDLPVLITMGTASMIGSYVGSHLGISLNPVAMRRLIGVAIVLMAIALFINGVRL
ncbi:MAG: sulfite exporter TauE/SafE family protein [Planctomycetes bacterium]|nr:sulfite exporter TauE/SafE family protein [Planctomycetota bacterium]